MAERAVIVDPDNGAGTDYTSLSAAEAAEQTIGADLVTDTDNMVFNCRASSSTDDTTVVDFAGWTTSSAYDIEINGNQTTGVWSSSIYTLSLTTIGVLLTLSSQYITATNLQLSLSDNDWGATIAILMSTNNCKVISNIIRYTGSGSNRVGIRNLVSSTIETNVLYGFDDMAILNTGYSGSTSTVFNNIIADCNIGVSRGGDQTVTAVNNVCCNNTDDYNGTFSTFTNNASDQGAGEGTSGIDISATWDSTCFTDTDGLGPDWSIQDVDSPLYDVGTATGQPTTDITGYTWVTDDIGAFAWQTSGGGVTIPIMSHHFTKNIGAR